MAEKTFMLNQADDYLHSLEVSSDSKEESLGDLQFAKIYLRPHSIPVDQVVMLILMMETQ